MTHLTPPLQEFDAAVADAVVYALCAGSTLVDACEAEGMPPPQDVSAWALADPDFARRLDTARREGTMLRADRIVARCEGRHIPEARQPKTHSDEATRDRLAFAANRWLLACYNPEVFGRVSARRAADQAAGAEATELALARAADLAEAASTANAHYETLYGAVCRAKQAGTYACDTIELDGCVLPLGRYVRANRISTEALMRDLAARRIAAKIRLGVAPDPDELTGGGFDPELLAALTTEREDGDAPITLAPGPLPGGKEDEIDLPAASWSVIEDDDDEDDDLDPRFAAVEAAFNGTAAPASAAAPVDADGPERPSEDEIEAYWAYREAGITHPGEVAMGKIPRPEGYERCQAWFRRHPPRVQPLVDWADPSRSSMARYCAEPNVITHYDIHADLKRWDDSS